MTPKERLKDIIDTNRKCVVAMNKISAGDIPASAKNLQSIADKLSYNEVQLNKLYRKPENQLEIWKD